MKKVSFIFLSLSLILLSSSVFALDLGRLAGDWVDVDHSVRRLKITSSKDKDLLEVPVGTYEEDDGKEIDLIIQNKGERLYGPTSFRFESANSNDSEVLISAKWEGSLLSTPFLLTLDSKDDTLRLQYVLIEHSSMKGLSSEVFTHTYRRAQ
ncbi:MAG: hypothetical protein HYS98_07115 [Deltaproteobacteria bacterium]|nr:hypothetical protein [Deltaproteobacteria bacterium]